MSGALASGEISFFSTIAVFRAKYNTMLNMYKSTQSPWRTPMLISKCLVSPSRVSTTAEVFSYIISVALTILGGVSHARRIRNILFLSTESKAFLKSMKIMAVFFVVSHFLDDISESKDLG